MGEPKRKRTKGEGVLEAVCRRSGSPRSSAGRDFVTIALGGPLPMAQPAPWNTVKVFSATRAKEREGLGEKVTSWLQQNPGVVVVDKVVTQSSDVSFHCLTVVLFGRRG